MTSENTDIIRIEARIKDEIIDELRHGSLKPYEILRALQKHGISDKNVESIAAGIRKTWVEKDTGINLSNDNPYAMEIGTMGKSHDDTMIGFMPMPVKYVGRIMVNGEYANTAKEAKDSGFATGYPIVISILEGDVSKGLARGINAFNKLRGEIVTSLSDTVSTFNGASDGKGIITQIVNDGMTRDVLVECNNVRDAYILYKWIRGDGQNFFKREKGAFKSGHTHFVEAVPYLDGRDIHVRFKAIVGAANGMNKLTTSGKRAVEEMLAYAAKHKMLSGNANILSVSGNLCTDKKPSFTNMFLGRGTSVIAEAYFTPREIMESFFMKSPLLIPFTIQEFVKSVHGTMDASECNRIALKVANASRRRAHDTKDQMDALNKIMDDAQIDKETIQNRVALRFSEKLVNLNLKKNERGSIMAGSFSSNTHVANIAAGLYLAYGQDVAQIIETSLSRIEMELREAKNGTKLVYMTGNFPALELGTYMGETAWGAQKEHLKMTGVYGEGDDRGITRLKFAEIVAAVLFAGDVNLTANQAAAMHGSTKSSHR